MVTRSRWTLSLARGTALDAWLRRNGAEEKRHKSALQERENEDGVEEIPSRSDSGRVRAGPEA
jgi:predicted RNA polymerase sigma factor